MNLTEQDWADEEQRVHEVTAKLRIRITGLEDQVGRFNRMLLRFVSIIGMKSRWI